MSEEDLTKEEKLEAARKKFEELKKNKKKTKKHKKKTANETPELGTEIETEVATESNSDATKLEEEKSVDKTDAIKEEKSEFTQVKVEPESEVDEEDGEKYEKEKNELIEQNSKIVDENPNKKQLDSSHTSLMKPESQKEETLLDKSQEEDKTTVEKKNEPIIERSVEETIVLQDNSNETKDTSNEPALEELLSKETADEESTFLTETLQSTITQLKSENQELHSEIGKLKSDNLELKMTKMDLEMELETTKNELETQKEQVKRLTHQLTLAKTDALNSIKSNEDDGISLLSGTEYLHNTTSSFQNLTNFNINNTSQDYLDIVDVKERLKQWKGWNMDMHGWRSIGMGPVFEA